VALTIAYDELLRYTNGERDKWRTWFGQYPRAMEAPLQHDGRFPTVGKLIDHIFLVERRHLQRLTGDRLSQETGLSGSNASPLFDYGASVRRELEHLARTLDDTADEIRQIEIRDRKWPTSVRKLLFHILIHETRHWAQIALAVRLAGFDPPGDHDLFFSQALQ
jgi:uncharacterized damage-inducible protein DinB